MIILDYLRDFLGLCLLEIYWADKIVVRHGQLTLMLIPEILFNKQIPKKIKIGNFKM